MYVFWQETVCPWVLQCLPVVHQWVSRHSIQLPTTIKQDEPTAVTKNVKIPRHEFFTSYVQFMAIGYYLFTEKVKTEEDLHYISHEIVIQVKHRSNHEISHFQET